MQLCFFIVLVWAGTVNFLQNILYGAVFWTCAGISAGNKGVFWLLLACAYTQSRPFLLLTSPHSTNEESGVHKEPGGDSQDSWPQLIQGISQSTWHHGQHTNLREEGRGGMTGVMTFVFPSHWYIWGSPAVLGLLGSGEWIPCFGLLACTASALPNELSLCQLTRFLTFTPLILSPILLRGGSGCVGLMLAGVKSQHSLKNNCALHGHHTQNTIKPP